MYPAFSQVSQTTVVFNKKPSGLLWDSVCTSTCSVLSSDLKFTCANDYVMSQAACDCDQQLQLLRRSLEVSLNLLALLWIQTPAFLLLHSYRMNQCFFRVSFHIFKIQHNTLSSSLFSLLKDLKGPSGILLHCSPM